MSRHRASQLLKNTCKHRLSASRGIISLAVHNSIDLSTKQESCAGDDDLIPDVLLFGQNSVRAALTARKRGFRHLYFYGNDSDKQAMVKLAAKLAVPQTEVDNKGVLNNLSGNRPHNGLVLSCSPLMEPLIANLGSLNDSWLPMSSDTAELISSAAAVARTTAQEGFPVYLLLDEVTDPQNIGSVIRTAYFMGVTGIVLSSKNCSSITPAAVKASSGATEFMPLFRTPSTVSFLRASQKNGWTAVATIGPQDVPSKRKLCSLSSLANLRARGPTIFVFGSEGAGLRGLVKQECAKITTIPVKGNINPVVDSLNVGVAAGIILAAATHSRQKSMGS